MKKLRRLQKTLLVAFSLLMVGCGIDRPDTNICVLSAPGFKGYCYNLKNDYDDRGNIKPQARLREIEVKDLSAINKALFVDPNTPPNNQGLTNLKAYIGALRKVADR